MDRRFLVSPLPRRPGVDSHAASSRRYPGSREAKAVPHSNETTPSPQAYGPRRKCRRDIHGLQTSLAIGSGPGYQRESNYEATCLRGVNRARGHGTE